MTRNLVVIPLDGSAFSRRILEPVQKFLTPDENKLVLLRVMRDSPGFVPAPPQPAAIETDMPMYTSHRDAERAHHPIYATQVQESERAEVLADLQDLVRQLEASGYEVDVEICYGDPAEEIANYVEAKDADLVAMTTHGRTGINKLLFGSVAQELVRRIATPLLLLRPFD